MITFIIVVCLVLGLGAILVSAIGSLLAVALPVIGGGFLLLLAIGIIQNYGWVLLKAAAVIFGVLLVVSVFYIICTKIKLILDTKKYVKWLNSVGICENSSTPFSSEVRERAVFKGTALRLNATYTASLRFYREVETGALQKQLLTMRDFAVIVQAASSICVSPEGIASLMEYLAEKNSLVLFDPAMPAVPAVPEYCCIQHDLSCTLEELAKRTGGIQPDEFQATALRAEPIFQNAAWVPSAFLERLASMGEMNKVSMNNGTTLYIMKGFENSTEISLDDDF